jgi:hypothetical protein
MVEYCFFIFWGSLGFMLGVWDQLASRKPKAPCYQVPVAPKLNCETMSAAEDPAKEAVCLMKKSSTGRKAWHTFLPQSSMMWIWSTLLVVCEKVDIEAFQSFNPALKLLILKGHLLGCCLSHFPRFLFWKGSSSPHAWTLRSVLWSDPKARSRSEQRRDIIDLYFWICLDHYVSQLFPVDYIFGSLCNHYIIHCTSAATSGWVMKDSSQDLRRRLEREGAMPCNADNPRDPRAKWYCNNL